MSSHPCCAVRKELAGTRIAGGDSRSPARGRGRRDLVGSIFPCAILILLPKCPVCIAAYVAMGTGIGISVATATCLRSGTVILCAVLLTYFAVRYAKRILHSPTHPTPR
jgi:hypothetical protein